MKVLMCTYYAPGLVDGASASGHSLARHLRNQGTEVTLCTTDLGWPPEQKQPPRQENMRVFHAWFASGLEIAPSLIPYFIKSFSSYDLIHFRGIYSFSTLAGAAIAQCLGKPYLVSPLGNCPPTWENRHSRDKGTRKYLFFQLLAKRFIRGAKGIICASENEKQALMQLLDSSTQCISIPDGIEASEFSRPVPRNILENRLGIAEDKFIFLYLGRLSREKALEFLLQTWDKFIKQFSDAVLVLAGNSDLDPGYGAYLKQIASQISDPKSVLFPGSVSGGVKSALLQHSVCLLFPSFHESFGIVVLEALASGTPVLASHGTPWEILEKHDLGRWLPWDEQTWTKSMAQMLNLNGSKKAFSERSKLWVQERYSWQSSAERYLEVYREVLAA